MVLAAFDFKLGQGMGQSRAYHSAFFVIQLLSEARFGAAPGFFGLGLVNIFGAYGHIGHNSHSLASDFDKTFPYREKMIASIFACDHLARNDLGQKRHVLRIDAHLSFNAGQRDHLDIFRIRLGIGSDDL